MRSLSLFSILLVALLSFASFTFAQNPGTITAPAAGTKIKPGQSFQFGYKWHQDYCVSSYNITVALATSNPTSGAPLTGHYFGRFATGNFPSQGLPNPNPPVPNQLVMPNFALQPGGFGTGATASNLPVWLYVIEEWNTCTPTIGDTITVASAQLVYNATS